VALSTYYNDMKHYPIAEPNLSQYEKRLVLDALSSGWISSHGEYIPRFEQEFAQVTHRKYATSVCNGTASLHLILMALNIEQGDEVLVPDFTYVAAANAVLYVGATPVFVDCDPDTYTIDPQKVSEAITLKTKAIMAVHIYGNPCDMQALLRIARIHNLHVIEDAAEAHGAEYNNKPIGSFGVASGFSFFGNKTISTGEGGIVVTNSPKIYKRIAMLKNQGNDYKRQERFLDRYKHTVLGYNYRMTNIQAAIGCAQLSRLNTFLKKKRAIHAWYREFLAPAIDKNIIFFQKETYDAEHSYWMNSLTFTKPFDVEQISLSLSRAGIQTRPFFTPMHQLSFLKQYARRKTPVARDLHRRGIIIPSGASLTKKDVKVISNKLLSLLDNF